MAVDLHRQASQTRDLILFTAAYAVALCGIAFAFGWQRPCWSDECHFLRVVADFAERGLPAIADYNAGTPPLFYLIYAAWGGIFGFEPVALRSLTMLFSLGAGIVLHVVSREVRLSRGASFFLPFILLANPYGAGLSFFVYTDMAMMLFLLLALWAALRDRAGVFCAASMSALLIRQYAAFLNLAYAAVSLLRRRNAAGRRFPAGAAASALAFVPLAALFVLWGGVAPPQALEPFGEQSPVSFNPSSLALYISIMPVFLFPALIFRLKSFLFGPTAHITILCLSFLYFIAPVTPSAVTLEFTRHETVGLFHRFLLAILPSGALVHLVWFLCFLAGLHILYAVGRSAIDALRGGDTAAELLIDLSIISFFLIMPWSYQTWEKYAIPLIPFVGLRVLMFPRVEGNSDGRRTC